MTEHDALRRCSIGVITVVGDGDVVLRGRAARSSVVERRPEEPV
jgi:hypothetical protein